MELNARARPRVSKMLSGAAWWWYLDFQFARSFTPRFRVRNRNAISRAAISRHVVRTDYARQNGNSRTHYHRFSSGGETTVDVTATHGRRQICLRKESFTARRYRDKWFDLFTNFPVVAITYARRFSASAPLSRAESHSRSRFNERRGVGVPPRRRFANCAVRRASLKVPTPLCFNLSP